MTNIRQKIYKTLRWVEHYTKTDNVYLAKSGFWVSFGHVVAICSGLFVSLAFANLFPKESFGTYKFIVSITGLLGIFSLTGLGTSIVQSVARGFGGALRQGFRLNLKWSIGIFLGGLIFSTYYYINGNELLSFSFLLAGILTPFTNSAALYGAYLLGKKDFRRNSFYNSVRNLVPAIALIITLLLTQNLAVIITVYFLFAALVPLLLYYRAARIHRTNGERDPGLIPFSKHLSLMEIIGTIASQLDKILIFHYLGAAPLAIYAFAIAPVEQLQGGKKIFSTMIQPKMNERSFEELQRSSPRKSLLLIIYALCLALLWVIMAPYFYKFLFPQYLDSVVYSQIYSFTLLAVSGTMFNEILVAHKKTKELYLHRTVAPILQILLFLALLPRFGLMGLVVTHVLMRSLNGLALYYFVKFPFRIKSSS